MSDVNETLGMKLVREGKVEMQDQAECLACGAEGFFFASDDRVCPECGSEDVEPVPVPLYDEIAWEALPAAEAMGWALYEKIVKHGVPRAVIVRPKELQP